MTQILKHKIMGIKTFFHIDIAPQKDKKCCNNCKRFNLWGVSTGTCGRTGKDKLMTQWCKKIEIKL